MFSAVFLYFYLCKVSQNSAKNMKNTENEPPLKHNKQRFEVAIEAISTPLFSTLLKAALIAAFLMFTGLVIVFILIYLYEYVRNFSAPKYTKKQLIVLLTTFSKGI